MWLSKVQVVLSYKEMLGQLNYLGPVCIFTAPSKKKKLKGKELRTLARAHTHTHTTIQYEKSQFLNSKAFNLNFCSLPCHLITP